MRLSFGLLPRFHVNPEQWILRPHEDPANPKGKKSDITVRGVEENNPARLTDIDVRMVYPDAAAHYTKPTTKLLEPQEQDKNKKHKEAARRKGREFIPFVVTTDGAIGKEGRGLLSKIGDRLADKWKKDRSIVMGYIRT